MSIRLLLPAFAAILLACGTACAEDGAGTIVPKQPMMLNATCPMDGKAVDPHAGMVPITVGEGVEARHFAMGFCSSACCTMFGKDPAAVLKGKFAPGPKTDFK